MVLSTEEDKVLLNDIFQSTGDKFSQFLKAGQKASVYYSCTFLCFGGAEASSSSVHSP